MLVPLLRGCLGSFARLVFKKHQDKEMGKGKADVVKLPFRAGLIAQEHAKKEKTDNSRN